MASPPSTAASSRLAWLDALRGIGAIAVLAEHMLPWVSPRSGPTGSTSASTGFWCSSWSAGTSSRPRWNGGATCGSSGSAGSSGSIPLYLLVVGARPRDGVSGCRCAPRSPRDPVHGRGARHHAAGRGRRRRAWRTRCGRSPTRWSSTCWSPRCSSPGAHRRSGVIAVLAGITASAPRWRSPAAPLSGGWLSSLSAVVFIGRAACVITGRFRVPAACALGLMARSHCCCRQPGPLARPRRSSP